MDNGYSIDEGRKFKLDASQIDTRNDKKVLLDETDIGKA
jgi:hypothetical protein